MALSAASQLVNTPGNHGGHRPVLSNGYAYLLSPPCSMHEVGERPVALRYPWVVRTTRKRARPLIMRAYASAARWSGYSSIMGHTACKSLKASASAMSAGVPVKAPFMELP